jgi:hypothetical protein
LKRLSGLLNDKGDENNQNIVGNHINITKSSGNDMLINKQSFSANPRDLKK